MSKHARRPDSPNFDVPTIDQCLFHRCTRHADVRMLNGNEEGSQSECGACVAEDVVTLKAQLLLALDGYADRLTYSHQLAVKLASARNRLNLLEPGAGDFIDGNSGEPQ